MMTDAKMGPAPIPVAVRLERLSIPEPNSGCTLWLSRLDGAGYGMLKINRRETKAHRAAYEEAFGPIPDGKLVCHRCDNRACINPSHLFLGSVSDNARDMAAKNRHGRPKLTVEQARTIRSDGRMQRDIAAEYGVSQSLISRIRGGTKWVSA